MKPDVVTAHSFGEFAALTVSGMVSFEDMFEIVYYRDLWSPGKNVAGQMIAVEADRSKIQKTLEGQAYFISNCNSPTQTVISSASEAVPRLIECLHQEKVHAARAGSKPKLL